MKTTNQVLRFRVTLNEIRPEVWREIEVPIDYTFWDLHVALQDAIGWQDSHLHLFRVAIPGVAEPVEIGIPDPELSAQDSECLPGWLTPVRGLLRNVGDRATYLYDFGDGWEHDLVLEDLVPRVRGGRYPRCTAGERACPPEDCGGPGGYERLLEIIADPKHEEHEEMTAWLGRPWDAEAFDPAQVHFDNPKQRRKRAIG